MDGPHFVYRDVLWITDPKHAHPPCIIKSKKLKKSTKIYYWNNVLMNPPGINGDWGKTNQTRWRDDGKNNQRSENITFRNNVLVMPGGMSRGGKPGAKGDVLINDVDDHRRRARKMSMPARLPNSRFSWTPSSRYQAGLAEVRSLFVLRCSNEQTRFTH